MKGFESRSVLLVIISMVCIFSSSAICAPPAGYVKIWEDTFDGTSLNTANWTIGMRDPGTGDLVPGAAGRYYHNSSYANYITAEDVWVSGGNLYLQSQKRTYVGTDPAGTYDYTSGWIMSMHKVHFNKGYVEFRAQYPSGDKVWPAAWLIAEDLVWGPEWDMWEYFGYRPDYGYDVMIEALFSTEYPASEWDGSYTQPFDATYDCESWHVYGFEWTDTEARWYLDGNLIYTLDSSQVGNQGGTWPDEDMYIVLNNGVRTDSPDTNTTWPNYVVMDYIELYQLSSDLKDDTADSDIAVSGTVTGSHIDTHSSDNVYEAIQEIESGGNPANRYSYLEHKWTIDVTGHDTVTFNVQAYHTANAEGDDFVFAYSTDDSNYIDTLTVTKTSDDDTYQSYEMPNDTNGTVYIRVKDTDRTAGNKTLDTIYIDHMYIRSEVAGPAADFNGDDKVNFPDYAELADAWQSSLGQPAFNDIYDLHDDDTIDGIDLKLFCDEWLWGL